MVHRVLCGLLALVFVWSCKENNKVSSVRSPEAVSEEISNIQNSTGEITGTKEYCFATKTTARISKGSDYNFEFLKFTVTEDGKVKGVLLNAPYGTDGSRGSFEGIFHSEEALFSGKATYLAEGEMYSEQRDYQIKGDAVYLKSPDPEYPDLSLSSVSCETYAALFTEYQKQILANAVESEDRTLLQKVSFLKEQGLSEAQLNLVKFLQRQVELDNNYETQEYLLYIIDPYFCGSGGCNLLVVDEKGQVLSNTSVVKLPVYTRTTTLEDSRQATGTWKELVVWSQGWRRLQLADGAYPPNASMAPEVMETEVTMHPEQYHIILNYLD